MKKYWYCDRDAYGFKTGLTVCAEFPNKLVKNYQGLTWLACSLVHASGYVAENTVLYDNDEAATISALS